VSPPSMLAAGAAAGICFAILAVVSGAFGYLVFITLAAARAAAAQPQEAAGTVMTMDNPLKKHRGSLVSDVVAVGGGECGEHQPPPSTTRSTAPLPGPAGAASSSTTLLGAFASSLAVRRVLYWFCATLAFLAS